MIAVKRVPVHLACHCPWFVGKCLNPVARRRVLRWCKQHGEIKEEER